MSTWIIILVECVFGVSLPANFTIQWFLFCFLLVRKCSYELDIKQLFITSIMCISGDKCWVCAFFPPPGLLQRPQWRSNKNEGSCRLWNICFTVWHHIEFSNFDWPGSAALQLWWTGGSVGLRCGEIDFSPRFHLDPNWCETPRCALQAGGAPLSSFSCVWKYTETLKDTSFRTVHGPVRWPWQAALGPSSLIVLLCNVGDGLLFQCRGENQQ